MRYEGKGWAIAKMDPLQTTVGFIHCKKKYEWLGETLGIRNRKQIYIWVCLKIGYIPNEIAIFHRDNDQQNHWVEWGTQHFQTHPYSLGILTIHLNPFGGSQF